LNDIRYPIFKSKELLFLSENTLKFEKNLDIFILHDNTDKLE